MRKILNVNVKKIIKYVLLVTLFIAVGWMLISDFFTHRASDKSLDAVHRRPSYGHKKAGSIA